MEETRRNNPWLGLESYQEGEILYGRDEDIRDLTQCVLNDTDTVLFQHIGLRPGFWPTSPDVKTLVVPEGDIGSGVAFAVLRLLLLLPSCRTEILTLINSMS